MQGDSNIIVTDTSCLILLAKIDELQLLNKLGKHVYITTIIQKEYHVKLPEWIQVADPSISQYQHILKLDLDKGEASAIAISLEMNHPLLLIDDLKGRRVAEKLGIRYSGTFGLLLHAKKTGM